MSITSNDKIKWKFKLGGTLIDFPNPLGSIEDNKKILAQNFPQLRWTEVYEEDAHLEDGCMVLPVVPPPVKTNG